MRTISFVSSKGGVGKTLGAILTAGEYAARGKRVLVIDADPTSRFSDWHQICVEDGLATSGITVTQAKSQNKIVDELRDAQPLFDVVVIDAPGTDGIVNQEIMRQSDLIITPMKIGRDETQAMADVAVLLADMGDKEGRTIKHVTYLTEVVETQKSSISYKTLVKFLTNMTDAGYETSMLGTELYARNIYKDLRNGLGTLQTLEVTPTISKALVEVSSLVDEIDTALNLPAQA